jgi:hypothetical protein
LFWPRRRRTRTLNSLPVFAADGIKIGQVLDVSMTDGRIDQMRVSTGDSNMIKGDMVLIPDLSAEVVQALPSDQAEGHGLRRARRR